MSRKLFFITSCIKTVSAPLSYAPVRSVFTHEQRFTQTLETIQSIRDLSPDSVIFFYEMSAIQYDWASEIGRSVDRFVSFAQHDVAKVRLMQQSQNKSMSEAFYTSMILEDIEKSTLSVPTICKLSGRYRLNAATYNDEALVDEHSLVLKKPYVEGDRKWYQLALFSFPFTLLKDMQKTYAEVLKLTEQGYDIETSMYKTLHQNQMPIREVDIIGANGHVAPTGRYEEY